MVAPPVVNVLPAAAAVVADAAGASLVVLSGFVPTDSGANFLPASTAWVVFPASSFHCLDVLAKTRLVIVSARGVAFAWRFALAIEQAALCRLRGIMMESYTPIRSCDQAICCVVSQCIAWLGSG